MVPLIEKCSLYKPYLHREHGWCMGTWPETVSIVDMLMMPWQPEILTQVRSASQKTERSKYKKHLWGITPSTIQDGGRGIKYVKEHNGLMQFDIDPDDNEILLQPGGLTKVKEFLKAIPFTVYCGVSASGTGLWGLFRISHPHLHSQHFEAMYKEFLNSGIELDTAPRNPASLRFVAHDPEGYYNEDAVIFDIRIEPEIKKATPLKIESRLETNSNTNSNTDITGKELCERFNAECTSELMDEILVNFGFQYHSHIGKSYRYTRPGKDPKTEGLSIDYHEDLRTLYSFSSNVAGLDKWKANGETGWSCSPLTALLLYGFGGETKKDWAQAFAWIRDKLNIK